ncbi:hypothetical protein [Bacillus sp. T33-2]|uniref:hypothetical protein n=1 Tax=Bacillus sp. T33-2 TaxID=2054168 RepID=UPI000C788DE9|nr:hypothetical protein [Bacillus sp. T33-2]PLR96891.1 hypothetical protein CVD19_09890 [Bacillus sp. T33-2]
MDVSRKFIFLPLSLMLLVSSGCSEEEVVQSTNEASKEIEQKTGEAAEQVKEGADQLAETVKKETPVIVENMKVSYKEGEKQVEENTLQKGDKARTKKDAYLAVTPDAYDELYQLIEVNDLKGVEGIEKNNQVTAIQQDSEVEIIERDVIRAKVKMSDSGKEGYLPTSLLEPVN